MSECPLCGLSLETESVTTGDGNIFSCVNCGPYRASNSFLAVVQSLDGRGRAAISHRLILRRSGEGIPRVTSYDVDDAEKNPALPGIPEAINRLLLWVFQNSSALGDLVDLRNQEVIAFVGVESGQAVPLLLRTLKTDGLVDVWPYKGGAKVQLTPEGWQKAEESEAMGSVRFRQTDWNRVNRTVDELRSRLATAETEEQCQGIGLLCREILISAGQAVSAIDPQKPESQVPSPTDAKAHLEAFLSGRIQVSTQSVTRKYARAAWGLAVELQHHRTATPQQAALCAEATAAAINVVSILANDPRHAV